MRTFIVPLTMSFMFYVSPSLSQPHDYKEGDTAADPETSTVEESSSNPLTSGAVTFKKPVVKEKVTPKQDTTATAPVESKPEQKTTTTPTRTTASEPPRVSERRSILSDVKPIDVKPIKPLEIKKASVAQPKLDEYTEREYSDKQGAEGAKKKGTEYTSTTELELSCYKEVRNPDGTADLVKVSGNGIPVFTNARRNPGIPKSPDQMLTGSFKNPITALTAKGPGMDVVYDVNPFTIPLGSRGETSDYYNTAADDAESREQIITGGKELTQAGFVNRNGTLCFTSGGGGGQMNGGKGNLAAAPKQN